MKNYKLTFGKDEEAVTFIERNCVSFSEAVIRLEYTKLDFTALTNVEAFDDEKMSSLEIRKMIEKETGLKISMRKESVSGSLRGYMRFTSRNVKGVLSEWDFEFTQKMKEKFNAPEPNPTFCNNYSLLVYFGNHIY